MKILFIGNIGCGGKPKGGGQFKAHLLLETYKRIDNSKFKTIDTDGYNKNPRIILNLLYQIFVKKYDVIFLCTATKSADRLFTLVSIFRNEELKKIVYHPQGMYIEEAILAGIYSADKYKSMRMVYLESKRAARLFKERGINAFFFPNFKKFNLDKIYVQQKEADSTIWKFIFLSRISIDKGVFLLLDAIQKLESQTRTIQIDFFGHIDEDIKLEFEFRLKNTSNVNYCGFLDLMYETDCSYDLISTYDLMILPTFWKGEGIAGVFIDAFISGLPVLTTSWNVNEEVVFDNYNGWIIPINDVDALVDKLTMVLTDINKLNEMKRNAFSSRVDYNFEIVSESLICDIQYGN